MSPWPAAKPALAAPPFELFSWRTLLLGAQFLALLVALEINRHAEQMYPVAWGAIPVALAVALARARYGAAERPAVRLWQLIGTLSAVYSLAHYPLVPPVRADFVGIGLYALLILAWVASLAGGVLCYRVPSLAVLSPAFLLWGSSFAPSITGLRVTTMLDIAPLGEVSTCIAIGLLIRQLSAGVERRLWRREIDTGYAQLLVLVAIAIHLANYFSSFLMKIELPGPPAAWLTENNPVYIFLVALDDGHIFFQGYAGVVSWLIRFVNAVHLVSNFGVLAIQAAAILAFFMPKRAFVILLLLFDAMHLSIIVLVGANFWPWIILNVIITIVVAMPDYDRPPMALRLAATLFILFASHFVANVAWLGWYDSGANNKLYFQAVDDHGRRYDVPTNFFTFYSYAISHMDYGSPDPATAFVTNEPNGGADNYQLFQAGRHCDVPVLQRGGTAKGFDPGLPAFVRSYHALALKIIGTFGTFPYDLYPHHFYIPFSLSKDFDALDKRRIVAYIYRRESVCMSFDDSGVHRKLVSTGEYRIDLDGADGGGQSGH